MRPSDSVNISAKSASLIARLVKSTLSGFVTTLMILVVQEAFAAAKAKANLG